MRHWPLRELGYAVSFIVVVLLLYVIAYAVLLDRVPLVAGHHRTDRLEAEYRVGGYTSRAVFGPLQSVDEKLFPDRWIDHEFVRTDALIREKLRRAKESVFWGGIDQPPPSK